MKTIIIIMTVTVISFFTGCNRDSEVASYNLSVAADMFEVDRRIVFYNGITDKYILNIEGKCSIKVDRSDRQLEVTCKVADGNSASAYKKHYLGLSDNVTYFIEQLQPKGVSVYHYRVIFKPQSIIPDMEFKGSMSELIK